MKAVLSNRAHFKPLFSMRGSGIRDQGIRGSGDQGIRDQGIRDQGIRASGIRRSVGITFIRDQEISGRLCLLGLMFVLTYVLWH